MKKLILLFVLSLTIVSGAQDKTFWKNGKIKTEKIAASNGSVIWKTYYENGNLESYTEDLNRQQHGNVKFYYPSGKLQTDCNYMYGKVEGSCIQYYESGQIKLSETYLDGIKHGESTFFNEQGKETSFTTYFNGKPLGPFRKYKFDGTLLEEGTSGASGYEGKRTYVQEDGVKVEETYVNGLKNGKTIAWNKDGSKYSESTFVNDKQHGKSFMYFPDGKVSHQYSHNHGKKDGESINYNQDGTVESKYIYANDVLVKSINDKGEEKVYENQNVKVLQKDLKKNEPLNTSIAIKEDGKDAGANFRVYVGKFKGDPPTNFLKTALKEQNNGLIDSETNHAGETTYYSIWHGPFKDAFNMKLSLKSKGFSDAKIVCIDAKKEQPIEKLDPPQNGEFVKTDKNGLETIENYKDGILNGPWVKKYADGKIFQKGNMVDGKLDGSFIAYHENGKVMSKGKYQEGRKHGVWIVYHPNGNVSQDVTFDRGLEEGIVKFYSAKEVDYGWFRMEKGDIKEVYETSINHEGELYQIWTEKNGKSDYSKPNGKYTIKYRNGGAYLRCQYKNEKRFGKWKWYDEKGNLCLERWFEDDNMIKEIKHREFDPVIYSQD